MTTTNKIDDGGAAFPRPLGSIVGQEWSTSQEGMSLRDYFAARFACVLLDHAIGSSGPIVPPDDLVASIAYRYADAMLVERTRVIS